MLGCAALASLAGCSLIYNPANLPDPLTDGDPPPDVMPDSEDKLDANPALLSIQQVFPADLFEGTGTGGSRQGLLTVHGMNLVAGAKISVQVHGGGPDPKITIDDDATDVAANGNIVAAPFTLDIDDQLAEGESIRLDVIVTQPNGASTVTAMLTEKTEGQDDAVLQIHGLDELTGAAEVTGSKQYSEVNADSITATAGDANPLIIHARGRINVTGAITANASGRTGGAGGNLGGTGGAVANQGGPGAGPGGPGTGGKPNGGGGGFKDPGGGGASGGPASGQPEIVTLDPPNRSSGGAGGNGGLNLGGGGDGGGGGGSIALTAGGSLTVTTVEAKGANGMGGGGTASAGGGGSGGLLLLRGAEVTATTLDVSGGLVGTNTGSAGRTRVDSGSTAAPAADYRGVMIDKAAPVITKDPTPDITVYGADNVSFKYRIKSLNSAQVSNNLDGAIGPDGVNTFALGAELFRGLNEVCVFVPGADLVNQRDEAKNCLQIVYLFTP